MNLIHNFKFIALSILLAIGIAACDKSGPAESAGKNIDQTMEKAGDKMDDAADKVGDSIDKVEDKIEDSMSDKK